MSNDLVVNNKLFKAGGVIGRGQFFINGLLLCPLILLALAPFGIGALVGEFFALVGGLVSCGLMMPVAYWAWINNFKRLRDIRGTSQNETIFFVSTFILFCIPYVSIIGSIFLMVKEGMITGNGDGLGAVFKNTVHAYYEAKNETQANTINQEPSSEPIYNKNTSEESTVEKLTKIHNLKSSGAISDEEYKKLKDDIFSKKAA